MTPSRGQRRDLRSCRRALLCVVAIAALTLSAMESGWAENPWAKSGNAWGSSHNAWGSTNNPWANSNNAWGDAKNAWANSSNAWGRSPSPKAGNGWPNAGSGEPSNYGGYVAIPSEAIVGLPSMQPRGVDYIDTGAIPDGLTPRPAKRVARHRSSGAPSANETRLIADEVLIELAKPLGPQEIEALQKRHHLTGIATQALPKTNGTIHRWRIIDKRRVAAVVRALEADANIASAQPNYLFTLLRDETKADSSKSAPDGGLNQYQLAKLRLPQAHALTQGDNIKVAVIDSEIDAWHPDLAGSIAQAFDVTGTPAMPDRHGTAVAGLIAGHGRLTGTAPGAQLLAIRAFDGAGAPANSLDILKAIDWAVANGARVIDMNFAGPTDPAIRRSLEAAARKNIVLVAPAGNGGAKSPPNFPASDSNVIAVSATGADDKPFDRSSRGGNIALAAPGANITVAIPNGGYETSSDTSYAAAEVSGIVALMLARKPGLKLAKVLSVLRASAKDLGRKGRDPIYGAGLVDAYAAVAAEAEPMAAARPRPSAARTKASSH